MRKDRGFKLLGDKNPHFAPDSLQAYRPLPGPIWPFLGVVLGKKGLNTGCFWFESHKPRPFSHTRKRTLVSCLAPLPPQAPKPGLASRTLQAAPPLGHPFLATRSSLGGHHQTIGLFLAFDM
jgi:hypothetical protein